MKIAVVHDYLCGIGGSERVFQYICEEFAEAESSGGGSSGSQASAQSVPTVAELLVLKAMQQDIAARTARFQGSFEAADRSPPQSGQMGGNAEPSAQVAGERAHIGALAATDGKDRMVRVRLVH